MLGCPSTVYLVLVQSVHSPARPHTAHEIWNRPKNGPSLGLVKQPATFGPWGTGGTGLVGGGIESGSNTQIAIAIAAA